MPIYISKSCSTCKKLKHEFNSQGYTCLDCHRERNRKWSDKNRELKKTIDNKYRKANKQILSQERKEEIRLRNQLNGYITQKKYKQTEKGKISNRRSSKCYRSRKLGAKNHHSEEEWQNLLKDFNYQCVICKTTDNITRDHIIPLSKGGEDNIENIQPLCRSCNCKKSNKIIEN